MKTKNEIDWKDASKELTEEEIREAMEVLENEAPAPRIEAWFDIEVAQTNSGLSIEQCVDGCYVGKFWIPIEEWPNVGYA